MKIGNQMTLKSSPLGLFIAAPVIRSTGVHLGLAFFAPYSSLDSCDSIHMCSCSDSGKLMGVVDSFSVNSNSALILWKTVSCAALCTSKRGMAVATHAELLAAENELLAAEGTSVMKENVTHETSQSDQNSKSIILRNPGVIIKIIVLLFGVYRNRCHMQLMLILYKMFKYDWSYVSNLKFSFVYS
ncbi:unnamed protein product [Brassica oleracea]